MSYINSTLIADEQVLYQAAVSRWYLFPLILFGVLWLPIFGLGLIFLIWAAIIYWTTELAVTNKRVIAKKGFIQRNTTEMFLSKVESVEVEQGVIGRMFNFGTVIISVTGTDKASFQHISHPLQFRKEFMTAADAAASPARPTIETVEPRTEAVKEAISTPEVNPTPAPEPVASTRTLEERLVELKRLFDAGLITQEVYTEQQRKLLEGQG